MYIYGKIPSTANETGAAQAVRKGEKMKANSIKQAWDMVNELFPTDYMKDEQASQKAGYPVYWSTAEGVNAWISDLTSRLEVNFADGHSVNIWIEEDQEQEEKEVRTEKTITARYEEVTFARNEETAKKASASLTLGIDAKLEHIAEFMQDMKHLHTMAMKAVKAGNSFQFCITEARYRWTGNKLGTISFDAWEAVPVYEQDEEGIYFKPVTRYTEEHRDMYIRKGHIFEDMAEYIR